MRTIAFDDIVKKVKDACMKAVKDAGVKFEEVTVDAGTYDKMKEIGGKPLWDKWINEMESKGLAGKKVFEAAKALLEKYK